MQESRQEQDRKTETKRNLSTLKRSQENAINGKRKDSAQEKTHDVSVAMRTNVTNTRDRLLLLQSRRRKAMEKFFDNKNSQRSEYIWEEISKTAQRLHHWEMYEHLVSSLASSGVSKLQAEWRCKFIEKCAFTHRGNDSQPRKKKSKQIGGFDSVAILKNSRKFVCVFQEIEPLKSNSILRKDTQSLGAQCSVQFSKRYITSNENSGKERIRRKVRFSTLDLMTAVSILKNMRTDLKRNSCCRNDASAETRGK